MKKKLFIFIFLFTLIFIPKVYASCDEGYYVVTYNANGGSGGASPTCVSHTLSGIKPTRSGYKFLGWSTSKNSTTAEYKASGYIELDGNLTLYAVWAKGVTLTYNAQGGKVSSSTKKVYSSLKYGTLLTPTKKGHKFLGWFTEPSGGDQITDSSIVVMKKNHTIYAQWKKLKFTITYELNGGTNSAKNRTSYYVTTGTFKLETPTKKGYSFAGWYKDSTFKSKVTYVYKGTTGSKKFYAKWTPNKYNITFYGNGYNSGSTKKQTGLKYNKTYTLNANGFKKTDYVFNGWNTKADGSGTTYANKASVKNLTAKNNKTISLYAQWKRREYKITYELNGGTNPDNQYYTFTKVSSITLKEPTRDGYTFLGWYADSDFEQRVTKIEKGTTGNKTFYAKWKFEAYTVTYVLNGGTNPSDAVTTYRMNEEKELPEPTKVGYTFGGWYTESNFVNRITRIESTMTGNLILYAKWDKINYTITYTLNGGTNPSNAPSSYTVTDEITLPIPTRNNYVFLGWYTDSSFTNEITKISKGTTGNKQLYAQWDLYEEYTITYELNGGTNPDGVVTIYTKSDEVILPTPTRMGYTFDGWYTESTFVNRVEKIEKRSTGNKTFYAKWTAIQYTITYNLNGGSNPSNAPTTYTIAAAVTLPTPEKLGYTFGGWYTNSSFTGNAVTTIAKGSIENKTYYAKWTINTYTITYSLQGGINPSNAPTSYTVETNTITLPTPTREGYTFDGWYTSAGTKVVQIPKGSTGNKSFTAEWTLTKYTITYSLNGGTIQSGAPTYYYFNSAPITLPTPTKSGSEFKGWYTNSSFTGGEVTTIASGSVGNKVFYAKWQQLESYTITYNLNGGSNPSNAPKTYTKVDAVTLPSPTRNGYTFGGWYTESEFINHVSVIPVGSTGNRVYYARWDIITYTITYALNGGTNPSSAPNTYTVVTSTITLPTPTRTGYTFDGWYTSDGTKVSTIQKGSTGNKSFSARWNLVTYPISYNSNGGTIPGGTPTSYTINSSTITLPTPTRTGYTFNGWYTNSDFTGSPVYTIASGSTGSRSFYAKWTLDIYTISFVSNGGTVSGSVPTSYTVTTGTITLPTPTRPGFTFMGWFTNSSMTGTAVTKITSGSTGNKIFYAKWVIIDYTITYVLNGGTNQGNAPTLYDVTSSTIILPTPIKNGYNFGGWYTNSSLTGNSVSTIEHGSTGNKTFYASWTTMPKYTITYILNGGTNPSSAPNNYDGSTAITLPTPTRDGYTFKGWYTSSTFSGSVVTTIPKGSTGNRTYYARWEIKQYTINYVLGGNGTVDGPNSYTIEDSVTLPTPTRDGCVFLGWYTNAEYTGNTVTTITQGNTGTKTFYAKWRYVPYYIRYNTNGGNLPGSAPTAFTVQDTVMLPTNVTKEGYGFDGWYTEATFENQITRIEAGTAQDIYVYAKWTQVSTYTITYNLNNGTNPSDAPTSYNNYETVVLPIPTREGYGFDGWYESSSFSGNPVTTIPKGSTGNKVYYAKWGTINTYTITYKLNGGTNPSGTPTTYTNYEIVNLPTPKRSGYTFAGWYTSSTFSGSPVTTLPKGTTGNKTYYAKWDENITERTYSYTFYNNTYDNVFTSLNDIKNTFYNIFNEGLTSFEATCTYSTCVSDFNSVFSDQDIMKSISDYENPYNSFDTMNAQRSYDGTTNYYTLTIQYNYSSSDKTAIDNALDNFISNNNVGTMSDIDKIKTFHDYLVNTITYDTAAANNPSNSAYANSFTAYGALLNGKAVCQGYADAMAIFLDRFKIPNLKVSSATHTWNLIYINNAWKHLDATWDDNGTSTVGYNYYLITTTQLHNLDVSSHTFIYANYLEAN